MCSNSAENMDDVKILYDSDIYETDVEVEAEEAPENDRHTLSEVMDASNMSENNVPVSSSQGNALSVNNTLSNSVSNINSSEVCPMENPVKSVIIQCDNVTNVLASSSGTNSESMSNSLIDSVSNSNCLEICTMENAIKSVGMQHESLRVSSSETECVAVNNALTNSVSNNNCLELCTAENTLETIENMQHDVLNDNVTDISASTSEANSVSVHNTLTISVLNSNSPEICTTESRMQTVEIMQHDILNDNTMNVLASSSESNSVSVRNTLTISVSSSNCPEICSMENTVKTVEVRQHDILNDNATSKLASSSETNSVSVHNILKISVSSNNCPEICNTKNQVKSIGVENEAPINVTNILESSLEENSLSVSNTVSNSVLNNNNSEMCAIENEVETDDTGEHDIVNDDLTSDDIMEIDEHCSQDIEYDFNQTPLQITKSLKEFNAGKKDNFTKGCKWAPDGSCILTCSDDNKLRLFNLPSQLWDSSKWSDISELEAVLTITEGGLIYDYCWYPFMNSNDVSTCCLISCSKRSTVHMWDGYTGELRCSYRTFNHLDELVTPYSLSFDSDGEKIFCGYRNVVRIFDVNRPGKLFEERAVYAYKAGQCGIISCFAFTSTDKHVSAAGSYNGTIGLYAEPFGELSCLIEGQEHGITQLQFSPDGKYLYSGGRKDSDILCWDLRNLGTVLFSLKRTCETNQRMYFDISKCGKYVVTGNQSGIITFWDVTKEPKILNENDFPVLAPINFFMAHNDCVNGVSFHPSYPLLCSSSGQRHFPELLDDSDSEDMFSFEAKHVDNSLRLWWIGK